MAETSTIFGFMKYVSATDILSDFKKTVDSYFVNSLNGLGNFPKPYFFSFLTLEYHLTKVSHKTHDDDKTNTIRQDHG